MGKESKEMNCIFNIEYLPWQMSTGMGTLIYMSTLNMNDIKCYTAYYDLEDIEHAHMTGMLNEIN